MSKETENTGMIATELIFALRKAKATIHIPQDPVAQRIAVASAAGLFCLCPADSAAVEPLEPDGIARIAAARKKYAIRNSIGYDLKNKSEASLMSVAADVIVGRRDSFGICRKHPDRDEQLEIAGALVAAILDMRAATKKEFRRLNLDAKFAEIKKEGIVESGDCMCGFCGNYKVVSSTMTPDRLWVKYSCPVCGRRGERAWLE
jgi:hypothetical protein